MRDTNPLGGKPATDPFVAAVRVQLALAGVSGAHMARLTGIPQSNFARRMTGDAPFLAEELVAIAAQLGVPASTLFEAAELVAIAKVKAQRETQAEPAEAGAA